MGFAGGGLERKDCIIYSNKTDNIPHNVAEVGMYMESFLQWNSVAMCWNSSLICIYLHIYIFNIVIYIYKFALI